MISILNGEDWMGVYVDDALVYEGHSIDPARLLEILAIPCEYQSCYDDETWEAWGYHCPDHFSEVPGHG